ncbi:MAG: iron-containing alcohol dehydrogenase [Archaeoglobus sp.]|jgi:alcohol dehydrogenase class IV|nr:iron-containing alcohol dehydrogenase [Archaeoglobus sp.]
MWSYVSPRLIIYGEDALEALSTENAERVLIVTDKSIERLGFIDAVKEKLKASKIEVFNEVEPEPSIDTAIACAKMARKFAPELIIAVGGGSVLDVAKMARILMEIDVDPIGILPSLDLTELGFKKRSKLIAIPTTSGTGADVTWACVLSDKAEKRKMTPANKEIVPDISILDYRIVEKMPKNLIAGSGMDALTHAIEGLVSIWKNDFSDAMCEKALELILENLEKSYNGDLSARAKMHIAATMAGLGFGNSQVGLVHSLGHAFGAFFNVHHGLSVGIFLPYVLQYYRKSNAKDILDKVSKKIGSGDINGLIARITTLMRNINVPTRVSEVVKEKEFFENIENLTMAALNDASLAMSPRIPDFGEIQKIYECAFFGREVDF